VTSASVYIRSVDDERRDDDDDDDGEFEGGQCRVERRQRQRRQLDHVDVLSTPAAGGGHLRRESVGVGGDVRRLRAADCGPVPAVRDGAALARRLSALFRLSDAARRRRRHVLHARRTHPLPRRLPQVRVVTSYRVR